jgi:phosphoribosylformylglycinamidine (FGAM) synthase-like amidotransferase family enzyme
MKSEWRKYNSKDPSTHPKENTRVHMKYADGTQVSGGYSMGRFLQSGVISANAVNQTTRWRYVEKSEFPR